MDTKIYPELEKEFPESERWICPNVEEYSLLNNPFLFAGNNFVMVVNACNVAVEIDAKNNVTSYAGDTSCSSDDIIQENIENVRIIYKAV